MIAIVLAVALSAAVPAPDQAKAARDYLDTALLDYPSARFKNVHMVDADHWCGDLNAKNAAGGYAGWKGFSLIRTEGGWVLWSDEKDLGHACDVWKDLAVLPADVTALLQPVAASVGRQ